jgi:hypothetical protein
MKKLFKNLNRKFGPYWHIIAYGFAWLFAGLYLSWRFYLEGDMTSTIIVEVCMMIISSVLLVFIDVNSKKLEEQKVSE